MQAVTFKGAKKLPYKLEIHLPAGWWLVPSVLGGALVWVELGMLVFR